MAEKIFKTHDELIALLISRGVDISTPTHKSFAKKHLQHEGYYNLINGYKDLFLQTSVPDETYKPGTTMEEIFALYSFDRKLRNLFLTYILQIETNVKSLVAYYFSKEYTHNNYLLYTNFDTNKRDSSKEIPKLIADIQKQIANYSNDPSIKHYLTKHGYVPLWVLNNILTLGTISKFFSLMKQKERQNVSKTFRITDSELGSALFYLSKIRNCCAHDNRLYCFRSTTPFANTDYHRSLNIPQVNGEYTYGKRDVFAAMLIFKRLLSRNDFNSLVKVLNKNLYDLRGQLNVLTEQDILDSLGFPLTWKSDLQKLK